MKVKSVKLKANKGILKIEDTNIYFVNSLRRIMLSELPKLAIHDVIMIANARVKDARVVRFGIP